MAGDLSKAFIGVGLLIRSSGGGAKLGVRCYKNTSNGGCLNLSGDCFIEGTKLCH